MTIGQMGGRPTTYFSAGMAVSNPSSHKSGKRKNCPTDLNFVGIRDVSNLVELFSDFPPGGFDGETIAFKYRVNSSVRRLNACKGLTTLMLYTKLGLLQRYANWFIPTVF